MGQIIEQEDEMGDISIDRDEIAQELETEECPAPSKKIT